MLCDRVRRDSLRKGVDVMPEAEPRSRKDAALLELRNVSFDYGDERKALDGINVALHKGQKIAVLGENGAGKSTFFLCCVGVLAPEHGDILLDGVPIRPRKRDLVKLRSSVGLVFQDPDDQIIASTVASEIAFGPLNMGFDENESRMRAAEAAHWLGLDSLMNRPPHLLSGGEKKRVTIADVLAMRPRIILLDEPTASLDPRGSRQLSDTLSRIADTGATIAVSTHDVDFAYAWADRILVFSEGKIVSDGDPRTVFSQPDLLSACGLEPPLLAMVADALRDARETEESDAIQPPRTIEELPRYLKELGI